MKISRSSRPNSFEGNFNAFGIGRVCFRHQRPDYPCVNDQHEVLSRIRNGQVFDGVPYARANFASGFAPTGANVRVAGVELVEQLGFAFCDFVTGHARPTSDG